MTDELILEWIKETCDAYCIPKPFAIIEALEADRATAEQRDSDDAARYRWLRDVSVPPHNFYMSVPEEFKDVKYSKADVDREIDKAIAAIPTRRRHD